MILKSFCYTSHADLHFVHHLNQGLDFHSLKKPTKHTCKQSFKRRPLPSSFTTSSIAFLPCNKNLGISTLPLLSSNIMQCFKFKDSSWLCQRWSRLPLSHIDNGSGAAQVGACTVHHAAVSGRHRCAAVLESELRSRRKSKSSSAIKSFSLPVRQAQTFHSSRKEHFVAYR